jgi:hypothetical protein
MTDDGDITILADYTTAGGWNVLPDFAPTIMTEPVGDKAIRYWQDLACANRKVAEDAQAQRDKAIAILKLMREEYRKLPHSLGYSFTHLPKIDEFLEECGK